MGCTVSMKSTSGSIVYYKGTPVVWSSKRQSITATSTCESEYWALYDTVKLCLQQGWLDWYLEQGRQLPLVFGDNQSSLALSRSSVTNKRSKHMDLRFHMVREHAKDLAFCPTDLNRADPLTKGLVGNKYISLFKPTWEELAQVEFGLGFEGCSWDSAGAALFVMGCI